MTIKRVVVMGVSIVISISSANANNVESQDGNDAELKVLQRDFESRCARDAYMQAWEEIDIDMKKISALLKVRGLPSTCKAVGQKQTELEGIQRRKEAAIEQAKLDEIERKKEEQRQLEEEQRLLEREKLGREAPQFLRKLERLDFCKLYGDFLRSENIDEIGAVKKPDELFKKEAARRKLNFSTKLIREEKVQIGMSECDLYASWGYPVTENRSVGSWGLHKQHVYGDFGPYVYTENGRVTSWQD